MAFRAAALYIIILFLIVASVDARINLPSSEPTYGFSLSNAFPGISFDEPVVITTPRGETNALYIAERRGRIIVIPDLRNPEPHVFLDLRATTYSTFGEAGLLGLAFHPDYQSNGRFYVYRTMHRQTQLRDDLTEFKRDTNNPWLADPSTEKSIISQHDYSDVHNAGDLHFGPDGYLYLSLGSDAPPPHDAHPEPQAIDKGLFGGVIRIDVDLRPNNLLPNPHPSTSIHYRIPKDNPFIGLEEFNGKTVNPGNVRTEFFAVGLRNPWRFTFHPLTGELICADVGSGYLEEINILDAGGNYGWPFLEGKNWLLQPNPPANLRGPVYEYAHGSGLYQGRAIIGGLIYTGGQMPQLAGKYLFGDVQMGHVWALDLQATNALPTWLVASAGISTFGTDPRDGEVLIANLYQRQIQKLYFSPPEISGIPMRLSEVNAFSNVPLLQVTNSIPFEVINPLWSDGAEKRRWAHFDEADGLIEFHEKQPWKVPVGSIFMKHFEMDFTVGDPTSRRPIETRFLVKTTNGLYGLSYRWGASTNDAVLVPPSGMEEILYLTENGQLRGKKWTYPGWQQCKTCHTEQAGEVLGFNTYQLNRPADSSTTNQIELLRQSGLFENPEDIDLLNLPRFTSLQDSSAPLQHKVRSYLHSNCVQCHQPGGSSMMDWDARASTPIELAGIINARSVWYPAPMKIITPGVPNLSFIYERTYHNNEPFRMPPLATAIPDKLFIQTLTNWIHTIPKPEWTSKNIGATILEGSAEQTGNSFKISGSGSGLEKDSIFYLSRVLTGIAAFAANLDSFRAPSSAQAGIMLRQNQLSESSYAALYRQGDELIFRVRSELSASSELIGSVRFRAIESIKLSRVGDVVSALFLDSSGEWKVLGTAFIEFPETITAGFFVASGDSPPDFATAVIPEYSASEIQFSAPVSQPIVLPRSIPLSATVSQHPATSPSVSFLTGTSQLASVAGEPYTHIWSNPPAGPHLLSAVVTSSFGSLTSQPVSVTILEPYDHVWQRGQDHETLGNWINQYGHLSAFIPSVLTNLDSRFTVHLKSGQSSSLGTTNSETALQNGGLDRIASLLRGNPTLELTITPTSQGLYRGAIYFVDWLSLGSSQVVSFQSPDGASETIDISATPAAYLNFTFRGPVNVKIQNPAGDAYLSGVFLDSTGDSPVLESYLIGNTVFLRALQESSDSEQPMVLEVSSNLKTWIPHSGVTITEISQTLREFTATTPLEGSAQFYRIRKVLP